MMPGAEAHTINDRIKIDTDDPLNGSELPSAD